MNRIGSRRILAALGISFLLAAGVQLAGAAQTAPRPLPANPQTENRAPDSQPNAQPQDRAPAQRPNAQPDRRDDGRFARGNDRLERRLDFLRSELRITAAQDRVWDDFANAVREETQDARDRLNNARNGRGRLGVIERLQRRQQTVENQGARLERLLATLRPLYAALNNDQKRSADELLFRPDRGRFADRGFGRRFDRGYRRGFGRGRFAMDDFATDPFDWRFGPSYR